MTLLLPPWQTPPSKLQLTEQAVHLWRFPLEGQDSLESLLDEQERQRARRLRAPGKARAFITGRACLRQILASYLDLAPQELHFNYGPFGKPVLTGHAADLVAFNLSHCGRWGLCAVTGGAEVGVDIERVDRPLDFEKLAARFFSCSERNLLQDTSPQRRRRLFFRIWTRKEAWLKGKGGGFSDPDQDIGSTHLAGCCTYDGSWWLRSFPIARHYLATLAVSRQLPFVQRFDGRPGR